MNRLFYQISMIFKFFIVSHLIIVSFSLLAYSNHTHPQFSITFFICAPAKFSFWLLLVLLNAFLKRLKLFFVFIFFSILIIIPFVASIHSISGVLAQLFSFFITISFFFSSYFSIVVLFLYLKFEFITILEE